MKRTEWFPVSIKPVYTGMYEVTNSPKQYPTDRKAAFSYYYNAGSTQWEDAAFTRGCLNFQYWRGLEKPYLSVEQMNEVLSHVDKLPSAGVVTPEKNPLIKPTRENELYTRLFRMRDVLEQLKEKARGIVDVIDRTLDEKYP